MPHPRLYAALVALSLLAPTPAGAQPAPAAAPNDVLLQEGRKAFEQADKALNLGKYEEALQNFELSYRLTGRNLLLYNLAYVNRLLYERSRTLAYLEQAIERYRSFLESVKTATDPKLVSQRDKGQKELDAAEQTLAREQASRAKGEEALTVGEQFVKERHLDDARGQLEKYERSPGNERPGVVRAFLLRASIAIAENHPSVAADAYASALELDKAVILPGDASDVARRAFAEGQAKVGTQVVFTVSHIAPASAKGGKPIELAFNGSPDSMNLVRGIQLYYRAGSGAYSTLPLPLGKLTLPQNFTRLLLPGAKIQYYANVIDRNGAYLQHVGTAELPFTVEVEKPPSNVFKKWWFWTAVAVVIGAAVGIGLGVNYAENPPPTEVPIPGAGALLHW